MTTTARHTSALAVGSAANGVLAYVFFAVTTRALGSDDAAPVAVLWAYWAFAGAALTFPVQHWVVRSVEVAGGEASVRSALGRVTWLVLGVAVVATGLAWLLRVQLFGRTDAWFPLIVGLVTVGSAWMGQVRGVLAARRRFAALGAALATENAVRCLAAGTLWAVGVDEPQWYGGCLVAGFVTAAGWPSTFRLDPAPDAGTRGSPAAFLGGTAGGQLIGQMVLTGGPVVLALAGGAPAEVTALFAGLALFRAPYTLGLGVIAPLTAWFTRRVLERDLRRLQLTRRLIAVSALTGALVAGCVGWLVGPQLLRVVFGPEVDLGQELCAMLAAASIVAIANLVLTVLMIAHGSTGLLLRSWLLALVSGGAWFGAGSGDALDRTVGGFVVVEVAAFAVLLLESARSDARMS